MNVYSLVGGTIDITAHQVMEDGNVRELIKATGGNWGGTRVDEEYMNFIKCLIGETTTKELSKNAANVFFEASREFELVKRTIKPNSDIKFTVRIPSQMGETYMKIHRAKYLKSVKSVLTKNKKTINISVIGDKLRMASNDAEDFFADSISKITCHLKRLFCLENGKDISTIILVGGFAESAMLIEGIKSNFPKMRIIIPQEATWSVLRGAVIFGHDPSLIRQRRSRYTYGVGIQEKFDPTKHDEKYKFEKKGESWCYHLFSKLLEVDEIVTVGEYQKEKAYFLTERNEDGDINLYSSTIQNPKYVFDQGCSYIGCILPSGHNFLLNENIFVKMCFGHTEIEVSAFQPKSKQTAVYYLGQ